MKWHKTTDIRDNPLIAETNGPYCLFWPREGRLCISEQGKHMDDHAVAVFDGLEQEEAEFIISKLTKFETA